MIEQSEIVRMALPQDETAIYALLVEMHRNNRAGWGFPYVSGIVMARIEAGTRPEPALRTNPQDQRRGIIGVIDGPEGLIGSIGLFIEPVAWFSSAVCLQELWLYVSPRAEDPHLYEALFQYGLWSHQEMKAKLGESYPMGFPYMTGFMHVGDKVEAMERLWRRYSQAEKAGVLFLKT